VNMDFFITVLPTGYEFFGRGLRRLYAAETLSVSPECKLVAVNLSTRVRKMSLIFSSDRFNREAAADKRPHEDLRLLRNNGWGGNVKCIHPIHCTVGLSGLGREGH
jgi:hypothetical protein